MCDEESQEKGKERAMQDKCRGTVLTIVKYQQTRRQEDEKMRKQTVRKEKDTMTVSSDESRLSLTLDTLLYCLIGTVS